MIVIPTTTLAPVEVVDKTQQIRWRKPLKSLLTNWKFLMLIVSIQLVFRVPGRILAGRAVPALVWFSFSYFVIVSLRVMYQLITYLLYDYPTDIDYKPTISVIIPVYNEEAFVEKCIDSVVNSDYPKEKMEIMVIDDGSTDNTWSVLVGLAAKYMDRITLLQNPQNMGKRAAMANGIRNSTGEIIITVDSDTVVSPNAFSEIVKGFVDPKTGAISGKITAWNNGDTLVSKAVAIRYLVAFDFTRASESANGIVQCCSGPLSAYRREIIMRELDYWEHQTFLGAKCTNGDDRALTAIVMRQGYDVHYARSAVARTIVPDSPQSLYHTLTRWDRSYLRETYLLAKFLIKSGDFKRRKILVFDMVTANFLLFGFYVSISTGLIWLIFRHDIYSLMFLGLLAYSIIIMGIYYAQFQKEEDSKAAMKYSIIYSFLHMTIGVAAMVRAAFTLKENKWLTR